MQTPAVAVLWESWRLTRARLLLVPALPTLCGWALLQGRPAPGLVFFVLFALAFAMALSLPLFGTRRAFPLSMAFARPIRTPVLVAVPLAYVFVTAAACYLVPAAILRVVTGVALPLLAPATLIGALAVLVAGCSWFTRIGAIRFGLAFAGLIVGGAMLRFLDPFRQAGRLPFKPDARLCVLSGSDYLIVALFIIGIYLWITFGVNRQRHGEEELSLRGATVAEPRENSADIFLWLRNACVELFRWRCPVSSPTAAEIWFAMQRYGVPVLAIGALLALCIPLLMWWANEVRSPIVLVVAACAPIAPFSAGVSASIWNRRNTARASVFAFEAARPIGTGRLIGLQVLVTSLCISGAWLLMILSAWISLPLLKDLHDYGSPFSVAMEVFQKYGLRSASFVVVGFIVLAAVLAFLAAFRAFASAYGWRFWLGALALVMYVIGVLIAVARGRIDGAVVGAHIWALAVAIPVATFIVLGRVLARHVLTFRHVVMLSLAWVLFAVLYLDVLRAGGMFAASPAVESLALASTLLPLLATALAPWSLSSIRHA